MGARIISAIDFALRQVEVSCKFAALCVRVCDKWRGPQWYRRKLGIRSVAISAFFPSNLVWIKVALRPRYVNF